MKKNLIAFLILSLVGHAWAGFVEVSQSDLDNNTDHTLVLNTAISSAGDGGGVVLPAGDLIVSSSVSINYDKFTLLGDGSGATRILLQNGAGVSFTSHSDCQFAVRGLMLLCENATGGTDAALELSVGSGAEGRATVRDVRIETDGGYWVDGIRAEGEFSEFIATDVRILGGFAGSGIRFADSGGLAMITNLELEGLVDGLLFDGVYTDTHLSRLTVTDVDLGIDQEEVAGLEVRLILNESFFYECDLAVRIASEAKISISDCHFLSSGITDETRRDILLNHGSIDGVVTGNDFERGVYAKEVDQVGFSGNVFRKGFRRVATEGIYDVLVNIKNQATFEGNVYSKAVDPIRNMKTDGEEKIDTIVALP